MLRLNRFFVETIELPIKQLSVLESWDLNFDEAETPISSGCSGVVSKIFVKANEFKERTLTNCPIDELAIKMMFNFKGNDQKTIAQKRKFDKEYIFSLAHPHWSHVQIFNYFRARRVDFLLHGMDLKDFEETTTYFTMELCKSNLKTYINENKNITVHSALLMIYQILDGIKHLYDHEVVHMDLKDDNIFIADRKKIRGTQVVIGDFGTIHPFLYKQHSEGNVPNRSPELTNFGRKKNTTAELSQFQKPNPVDISKNDVWAAGCILFQLLEGGTHPFCDAPGDTRFNICNGCLPLSTFDKHGEGTKQFLKLLWDRDPNKRLDPTTALGICGLLLWGAPNYIYSDNSLQFSAEKLRSENGFKKFCFENYHHEGDCQLWLNHRIDEAYKTYIQTQNNNTFDIEFLCSLHFLSSISPAKLLDCIKVFSRQN